MGVGNSFSFHRVDTHGSGVQKYIYHMVIKQVDFIDIKNISIGICQNPCFKRTLSFADSRFNVQCTYHAVFRSADRKFHHFHGEHFYRRFFMVIFFMAFIAPVGPVIGVAVETAALDAPARRQKVGQRTDSRRLGRPLLPLDEHAAQLWIDNIQH